MTLRDVRRRCFLRNSAEYQIILDAIYVVSLSSSGLILGLYLETAHDATPSLVLSSTWDAIVVLCIASHAK
jgi:hypothetical protein